MSAVKQNNRIRKHHKIVPKTPFPRNKNKPKWHVDKIVTTKTKVKTQVTIHNPGQVLSRFDCQRANKVP